MKPMMKVSLEGDTGVVEQSVNTKFCDLHQDVSEEKTISFYLDGKKVGSMCEPCYKNKLIPWMESRIITAKMKDRLANGKR